MEEMVAHNKEQKAKEEGSEYTLINMIKEMLKNNATIEFVSKVTKKTPEEIKKDRRIYERLTSIFFI